MERVLGKRVWEWEWFVEQEVEWAGLETGSCTGVDELVAILYVQHEYIYRIVLLRYFWISVAVESITTIWRVTRGKRYCSCVAGRRAMYAKHFKITVDFPRSLNGADDTLNIQYE